MSGKLGLGSPWSRSAIPPDERAAIEALIPDAWRINVTAHNGSPASFDLSAYGPHDYPYQPSLRWENRHDVAHAAREMARLIPRMMP